MRITAALAALILALTTTAAAHAQAASSFMTGVDPSKLVFTTPINPASSFHRPDNYLSTPSALSATNVSRFFGRNFNLRWPPQLPFFSYPYQEHDVIRSTADLPTMKVTTSFTR